MMSRGEEIQAEIKDLESEIDGYREDIEDLEEEIGSKESAISDAEDEIEELKMELAGLLDDPEEKARLEALEDWQKAFANPAQLKLPFVEVATP